MRRESTGASPPGPPRNDPRPPRSSSPSSRSGSSPASSSSGPGSSSRTSSTARTSSGRGQSRWPSIRKSRARSRRSTRWPRSADRGRQPSGASTTPPRRCVAAARLAGRAPGRPRLARRREHGGPFGEPSALVNDDWVADRCATRSAPRSRRCSSIPAAKQFFVSIGVPVVRGGRLRYVLGARILAQPSSAPSCAGNNRPADGVVALMDADLTIMARTRAEERLRRRQAEPRLPRRDPQRARGVAALDAPRGHSRRSRPGARPSSRAGPSASACRPPRSTARSGVAVAARDRRRRHPRRRPPPGLLVRWRIVRAQVAAVAAARALARGEPTPALDARASPSSTTSPRACAMRAHPRAALEGARRGRTRAGEGRRASSSTRSIREHAARVIGERNEARLLVTLSSIGDAVIATDAEGRVTILNPVAQTLTGWPEAEAIGTPIDTVFVTLDERTRQPNPSPLARIAATGGGVTLPSQALLIARDGREIPIGDSASPIQTRRRHAPRHRRRLSRHDGRARRRAAARGRARARAGGAAHRRDR